MCNLHLWRTQKKILSWTPFIESQGFRFKLNVHLKIQKHLLTGCCYYDIYLTHISELLCYLVMLAGGERSLKNVSRECWEALLDLHKAIYLLALLILHLNWRTIHFPQIIIFFPEVIRIISLILTVRKLVFLSPCEIKGKILVTLQSETEKKLNFHIPNLPVLDA